MPKVLSLGGEVDWPSDEGTIGVVGVAPWSTLDFLRVLYARVQVTKDWHFPRVIVDINTKLPSRGRHFELGERDPSPFIADSIEELAGQGASVVVVPCNTAHILYDRWAKNASVVVPNIIAATVDILLVRGATCAVTFASRSISACGLYDNRIKDLGKDVLSLNNSQIDLVQEIIGAVKLENAMNRDLTARARKLIADVQTCGADGIILGCTELASLQILCEEQGLFVAESNAALAEQALKIARVRMKK